ncbi:MAG: hypothetical protein HYX34_01070, partial [Actinobacteria bacterium]|nr:hypothetical protein [Actinomycetota bacterium]
MPAHLSIRVPWHDARWDGTVCRDPAANCHCIEYENILARKVVSVEIGQRGKHFADLDRKPPCHDESAGFLSARPWATDHEHPYKNWKLVANSHAHLEPARVNLSEADSFVNHCVVVGSSLGSLIHTAPGSFGGSGGLRTKRSGC